MRTNKNLSHLVTQTEVTLRAVALFIEKHKGMLKKLVEKNNLLKDYFPQVGSPRRTGTGDVSANKILLLSPALSLSLATSLSLLKPALSTKYKSCLSFL